MGDTLFGQWLEGKMRDTGTSDTKLAAHLNVTAPAIAKWRTGVNAPKDEAHLNGIAEFFSVSRIEVYKMAGRWVPGLELEGISPEMAKLAYRIQAQLDALEDPDIREVARGNLGTQIRAWEETIEALSQLRGKGEGT